MDLIKTATALHKTTIPLDFRIGERSVVFADFDDALPRPVVSNHGFQCIWVLLKFWSLKSTWFKQTFEFLEGWPLGALSRALGILEKVFEAHVCSFL